MAKPLSLQPTPRGDGVWLGGRWHESNGDGVWLGRWHESNGDGAQAITVAWCYDIVHALICQRLYSI